MLADGASETSNLAPASWWQRTSHILTTASTPVTVGSAIISVMFGVPGAIVTSNQIVEMKEESQRADSILAEAKILSTNTTRAVDELRRAANAAETQALSALAQVQQIRQQVDLMSQSVEESKKLSTNTENMVSQLKVSASAAADQALSAKAQLDYVEKQISIMKTQTNIYQSQLNTNNQLLEEQTRPRIKMNQFTIREFSLGKEIEIEVNAENTGMSDAVNLKMWANFDIDNSRDTYRTPVDCDKFSGYETSIGKGHVQWTRRSGFTVSSEAMQKLKEGGVYVYYGRICYEAGKRKYYTAFCSVLSIDKKMVSCPRGNNSN